MFDGSSIAGWKAINESDMLLAPDCATAVLDPFAAQTSLIIFCDMHEPVTGQPYGRDPRSIAKKAEQYLVSTGIGDTAYFGPEAEFFIFDDVRYKSTMQSASYDDRRRGRPLGQRQAVSPTAIPATARRSRAAISRCRRSTAQSDLRAEMLSVMADMGLKVEKHHHEVAPSQARTRQRVRHAGQDAPTACRSTNTSCTTSPTSTARPRPSCRSRSRATTARACTPTSRSGRASGRSSPAIWLRRSLARPRSTTSAASSSTPRRSTPSPTRRPTATSASSRASRRRCCWPIRRATARRRAASRSSRAPRRKRVEVRFPDPACNPYLGFAAMLMAGIDGIQNRIHPGDPMDKNLYDLPPEELKDVPTVCGSLREALGESARRPRLPDQGRRVHRGLHREPTSNCAGKRSTPSSTRRTRSSSRCTIRCEPNACGNEDGAGPSPAPLSFWRCIRYAPTAAVAERSDKSNGPRS